MYVPTVVLNQASVSPAYSDDDDNDALELSNRIVVISRVHARTHYPYITN